MSQSIDNKIIFQAVYDITLFDIFIKDYVDVLVTQAVMHTEACWVNVYQGNPPHPVNLSWWPRLLSDNSLVT